MLTTGYYIHIKFDSTYKDIYYRVESKMRAKTILMFINEFFTEEIDSILEKIKGNENLINYLTDEEYSSYDELYDILSDISEDIFDGYDKSCVNDITAKIFYIKNIEISELK